MKAIQVITPEIIAAISAGIGIVLGDNAVDSGEKRQGMLAVRFNNTQRLWKDAGRQSNMNNRLVR